MVCSSSGHLRKLNGGLHCSLCLRIIHLCTAAGDSELVGVLAELATVDDIQLSQVLAATFRGLLPVLVVRTSDCIKRLTQRLQHLQLPRPDMLSLSHTQPFK